MPHKPGIARLPFVGDFVGDYDPAFNSFLVGLPVLFLAPADTVYLRVGDAPAPI